MENIKLCEVCGKEHNGSYGSGRFCSYSCKQKYSSIRGAAATAKIAKEKFGIKCECEFCKEKFESKLDFKKHFPNCCKRIKFGSIKHGNWKCDICESIFETRALLAKHKKDEGHSSVGKGYVGKGHGTNKFIKAKLLGLPKPVVSDETRKKISDASKGRHLSEEQKQKISETIKKKIAEGSFIVPYKRNHSSKISYPEKYFIEVFKELPIEYNYQVGLYQLDFAIPEKKVYIEIDGEQHFVDKRIIEHDKERTKKLNALGWKCLKRIRWSEYQKLSQDDKNEFCKELITDLRNC